MNTITSDGVVVYEQRGTTRIIHTCFSRRVAQVYAAILELRDAGWTISGLGTSDRLRLPLLLPGERMGTLLDGSRSDARAQGFVATRAGDLLNVDACAAMAPRVFDERGDPREARRLVEWHLGMLA